MPFSVTAFNMIFSVGNINTHVIPAVATPGVQLDVLRLDTIHPVVSGNKWFKLSGYLRQARNRDAPGIVTFGGAYSNHIVAAVYAAKSAGMRSVGVIRGEEPQRYSPSLQDASANGMKLVFISRSEYAHRKRSPDLSWLDSSLHHYHLIPEGGAGEMGVTGASGILHLADGWETYSDIVTAIGTGTTTAGILKAAMPGQRITGISAMKNNKALYGEIEVLLQRSVTERLEVMHGYHFGGYGKYTEELLRWMNYFYHMSTIPLDFVYTGKMMFGIFDLLKRGYFSPGAKILAIHSGGLQGNRSLPAGSLDY